VAPSFNITELNRWTVIQVTGDVDVYSAPKLRAQIVDLIDEGRSQLVVDMEAVTFIDSTGLGVLVGTLKRLRASSGELRLVATGDHVLRLLRITGLHRILGAYPSAEEAAAGGAATPEVVRTGGKQ